MMAQGISTGPEAQATHWPAYPAYKPSGVPWLGEIPAHWEIMSLRHKLRDGSDGIRIGPFGSQLKLEIMQSSGYKVYGQENVISQDFTIGDKYINDDKFRQLASCEIRPGDLVISMMGTTGRCQVVPLAIEPGIINSHLIRLRIKNDELLPEYISLLIDTGDYIRAQLDLKSRGAIMQGLNSSIIKQLVIAVPAVVEQRAIAAFLDQKTAKLDVLIAKKERLIELLQEKRAALISRSVTKGLDSNVPLKDSGIEWFGEIPAHWSMRRLGELCLHISDINHEMPMAVEEGVPFLSAKDLLNGGTLNFSRDVKMISEADFSRLSRKAFPRRNDIIYSRIGACLGKARLVETDSRFLVSYSCCVIRLKQDIALPAFYRYILDSDLVLTEARLRTQGIGVPDLGLGEIARFPVPFPPMDEQKQIAAQLNCDVLKLDALMPKVGEGIERLREYRAALIAAAVTGKIDVRTPDDKSSG